MLGSGKIASAVADFLEDARLKNVVLDPVLKSSSGAELLDRSGVAVLMQRLLPLADVITPNVDEAAALPGWRSGTRSRWKLAAGRLHEMGAKAVVVTGGHLDEAIDVLSVRGEALQTFRASRMDSPNTHGTGCAFSTAVACQLALGQPLASCRALAKDYVLDGYQKQLFDWTWHGPVNHMHRMHGNSKNVMNAGFTSGACGFATGCRREMTRRRRSATGFATVGPPGSPHCRGR